jgi:hypothetical protein
MFAVVLLSCTAPGRYYPIRESVAPFEQVWPICDVQADVAYNEMLAQRTVGGSTGAVGIAGAGAEAVRFKRQYRNACLAQAGWVWRADQP